MSEPQASEPMSDDGLVRCPWGVAPPEYRRYHDEEWGRPVVDDTRLFEKLCLEGFQSGLSWLTILRKRDGFRRAFAGFDVANGRRLRAGRRRAAARRTRPSSATGARSRPPSPTPRQRSPSRRRRDRWLPWSGATSLPPEPAPTTMADLPPTTPESVALSRELRRRGFRFVGPTTVYAAMQSLGLVDDHLADCHVRPEVEAERAALPRPGG